MESELKLKPTITVNTHAQVYTLLSNAQDSDSFIISYYKSVGFGEKTTRELRDIWKNKNHILNHCVVNPQLTNEFINGTFEYCSRVKGIVRNTDQNCIKIQKNFRKIKA